MTLRHDSLPVDGDGAHGEAAGAEWRQTHAPLVTVQVWLGADKAMSSVVWHASINAVDEALLKPLDEMLTAAVALHTVAHRLEEGLMAALQYRDAPLPAAGGN